MEGNGCPSTSCRRMLRALAGELLLLEQCVPAARRSLCRLGEVVRSQRGGSDLTGNTARLFLRQGENTPWCHQPQPSAVDASDQADKEMPLRPKLEERKEWMWTWIQDFPLPSLWSHTLPSLPAHTHLDATLEQRQEAGGNLNIPKLFKSLNGFASMVETKVSSFYFSVVGTCEE